MPILIKGSGGAQEAPVITVSSSGLITAKAGGETTTKQLPTQAAKTITPGASSQVAVDAGVYTTGKVVVAATSVQPTIVTAKATSVDNTVTFECDGITASSQILCVYGTGYDEYDIMLSGIAYFPLNGGCFKLFRVRPSDDTLQDAILEADIGNGTVTLSNIYIGDNVVYSITISFI